MLSGAVVCDVGNPLTSWRQYGRYLLTAQSAVHHIHEGFERLVFEFGGYRNWRAYKYSYGAMTIRHFSLTPQSQGRFAALYTPAGSAQQHQ